MASLMVGIAINPFIKAYFQGDVANQFMIDVVTIGN